MSRLRLLGLGSLLLLAACHGAPLQPDVPPDGIALQTSVAPTAGAVTIEGTGDPTVDFPAIQAALDAGGTIHLKGHFVLGKENHLYVTRDVEILGEPPVASGPVDPVTGHPERTWPTLLTGGGGEDWGDFVIGSGEKVRVVIRNIHFDRYWGTAVAIRKATYAEVVDCLITNALPSVYPYLWHFGTAQGLAIGGWPTTDGGVDYPSVGHAVVEGNVVSVARDGLLYDRLCRPPVPLPDCWSVLTLGVVVAGMVDGTRVVQGNLVRDFGHLGILNMTGGTTTIEDNHVIAGNRGYSGGYRKAIAADWYVRHNFPAPVPLGQVYVRGNRLETDGSYSAGVTVFNPYNEPLAGDSRVVIEDNEIIMDRAPDGVSGSGLVRNVTVERNRVVGTMTDGVHFGDAPGSVGLVSSVTVLGNQIIGAIRRGVHFGDVQGSVVADNSIAITGGYGGIVAWSQMMDGPGSDGNSIRGNTLSGSAQYGILVGDQAPWPSSDGNSVSGNDLSGLTTELGLASLPASTDNHFVANTVGSATGWGVFAAGMSSQFTNTTFTGKYGGLGLFPGVFAFLDLGSAENILTSVKNGTPPHGFDVCGRVVDLNLANPPFTTTNRVPGIQRCDAPGAGVAAQVEAKIAEMLAQMAQLKNES